MMRRVLLVTLLLVGCETANPTVARLGNAKVQAAAGNHAAVAQIDASCAPSATGCAQLARVKADSCFRLATAPGTAQPAQRSALDCAVTNYDAALVAAQALADPEVPPGTVAVELLDAQARRRNLAPDRADALAQNAALRDRAQAAARMPGEPRQAGLILGADAELGLALLDSGSGCDGIQRAAVLLALSQPTGTLAVRKQSLERAVGNARQASSCTP